MVSGADIFMDTPATGRWRIKLADEEWEFEAIHRLNYRTFVEEIPQHHANADKRLVDRFHAENTYIIALDGRRLIGMLAVRGKRPFSLDDKVANLDQYLPPDSCPVEVRLLSVIPSARKSVLFTELFQYASRYCLAEGYDIAVISGTTRQLKLYRHLGFVPFGSLVGTETAAYQPMSLTLEAYRQSMQKSVALRQDTNTSPATDNELNFLPGPVWIAPEIRHAFAAPCISHRSQSFVNLMAQVQNDLCCLTHAEHVQILLGSGTLANEVIAAQLSLLQKPGLILANGEFGERLIVNARRAQLNYAALQSPWGTPFEMDSIAQAMAKLLPGSWVWMVHHETSTGMLNPLDAVKDLCAQSGLHLCLDCISSLGAMALDLHGVYLASGVSGKGLGAYPGLSMVFHRDHVQAQAERLPAYLDLGDWVAHGSIPFTHSSNLLNALALALKSASLERMASIRANMLWLRAALENSGFPVLVVPKDAGPAVLTLAMKAPGMAQALGEALDFRGYWLNYRSAYLSERNWIQIALFSNPPQKYLEKLVRVLDKVVAKK